MNSGPASPKVRAYLRQQLSHNPWEESDAIVRLRARALGLKRKTAESPGEDDLSEQREAARREIDAVRTGLFSEDIERLTAKLDRLQLDTLPDLAAAATRLRTVLGSRSKLPALAAHKDFDANFFDCFKQVLSAPARDTVVLRERVVASFSKRKLRRSGRAMIWLIERETPELYALEAPWMQTLQGNRRWASVFSLLRYYRMRGGLLLTIFILAHVLRAFSPTSEPVPDPELDKSQREMSDFRSDREEATQRRLAREARTQGSEYSAELERGIQAVREALARKSAHAGSNVQSYPYVLTAGVHPERGSAWATFSLPADDPRNPTDYAQQYLFRLRDAPAVVFERHLAEHQAFSESDDAESGWAYLEHLYKTAQQHPSSATIVPAADDPENPFEEID